MREIGWAFSREGESGSAEKHAAEGCAAPCSYGLDGESWKEEPQCHMNLCGDCEALTQSIVHIFNPYTGRDLEGLPALWLCIIRHFYQTRLSEPCPSPSPPAFWSKNIHPIRIVLSQPHPTDTGKVVSGRVICHDGY